jgi:transposase
MMTEDETATQRVIGGVDTHKDVHVAAVLDELGRLHDTATFATTTAGYRSFVSVAVRSRRGPRGRGRGHRILG